MWIARGLFIVAAAAALAMPATAQGWAGTFDGILEAGPQMTGSGTAWADVSNGPINVKRAPLNGPPETLFSITRDHCAQTVMDLAAAGDLVAVKVRQRAQDSACDHRVDLLVNDGAGGSKAVFTSSGEGFAGCELGAFDVDPTTVAVSRWNCPDEPVLLHDVASATTTALPLKLVPGDNPFQLRLAGRYLALLAGVDSNADPRHTIIVWDRETNTEAYRVDATALRGGRDWVAGSHRLALQPDGRVLYGVTTTDGGIVTRYGWASALSPVLTPVPGDFWETQGRIAFAGDAIAAHRNVSSGGIVVGLDGTNRNHFSPKPSVGSLDFDGTRLAWATDGLIHNEAYPYQPAAATPPVAPVAPPAKPASAPAARIGALKSSVRAKALKAFTGTATDADGDLLMVRVGLVRLSGRRCEVLQKSGRLARAKRSGRRCVPNVWLQASGTAAWKLKLRKRLVPGRYQLSVQAVDAGGQAQVTFTKAAGNLRAFKVTK